MAYSNVSKGPAIKGSKYWMQRVVEDQALQNRLNTMIGEPLVWLSPLAGEANTYDEYQLSDSYVLEKLGLSREEAKELFSFWPKRQPQWDGMALDKTGSTLYIVEAKAHTGEMETACSAKSLKSIELIKNSMETVKNTYYPDGGCIKAWYNAYYQLGNRLTFLRKLNEKPFGPITSVKLVLLNFVNDTYKPTTLEEWEEHYKKVWNIMIGKEFAPDGVLTVNFDVS